MAQISCEELAVGYGSHAVAEGLNFHIEEGDYLCIVGENGSGKTTLMHTMLGLQKPLKGTIRLNDGVTQKDIGYLPQQDGIQKDFPASVFEVVLSGCLNKVGLRPFYNQAEKRLAQKNMEKMGVLHLSGRMYQNLSGGQKQRVLLARALCAAEKILFLDEPVSGLDPKAMKEMYERIASLNREGITIIMISHDLEAAFQYAGRILHLGHDMFFGAKEDYFRDRFIKRGMEKESGAFFV